MKRLFALALLAFPLTLPAQVQISGNTVITGGTGSGSVGVSSINGVTGSFIFTGGGVSCTTTTCTFSGGGGGVSSVAFTAPSFLFAVSGSPITSSGTIGLTLATQSANTFFAGPSSGSAAAPTFRLIVASDIPALPYLPNSTVLPSTLGAVAHKFFTSYNSGSGLFVAAQPACADLSDSGSGCSSSAYSLPTASTTVLGGVKVDGSTITISGGVISATTGGSGTVSDGSGTATPGQIAESTSTTHTIQYVTANGAAVGLGSVTNDAQTKAAIMPNTAPSSGYLPAGNGSSYAPVAVSGDCSFTSAGLMTCTKTSGSVFGSLATQSSVTAAQLPSGIFSCTEVWSGSGTSSALTAGDDAISNNTCYNDSGATRTITAVKCRSDNASNTTTVNPAFGASGSGTTVLSAALTCGSSYAYSASGTITNASWTTGTGVNPVMGGTLTGTSIAVLIEYHY